MTTTNYDFEKEGKYYKYTNKYKKSSYEVIKCECQKWIKKSIIKSHMKTKYHKEHEKDEETPKTEM